MGNAVSSQGNFESDALEGTGIEGFETPIYRNPICSSMNEGNLVESYWDDINTCHQTFM